MRHRCQQPEQTICKSAKTAGNKAIAHCRHDKGVNIDIPKISKVSPRIADAFNGDLDTVEKRLAKNADILVVDQLKKSAMAYAAGNGHTEALSRLLMAGVHVDLRD